MRRTASFTDTFDRKLIGRFDEKIVFKPLSPKVQREIGRVAICQELELLCDRGFNLTISEAAFEFLVRRGIQKTLGVRPMRKTIQKFIGDAVKDALKSNADPSGTLVVDSSNIVEHLLAIQCKLSQTQHTYIGV